MFYVFIPSVVLYTVCKHLKLSELVLSKRVEPVKTKIYISPNYENQRNQRKTFKTKTETGFTMGKTP